MTATDFVDTATLDADALLQIPLDAPEQLFAFDVSTARRQWRTLSSRWHPDRNPSPKSRWVFAHVADLYRAAADKRDGGIWDAGGALRLVGHDGRSFRLAYRRSHRLSIGRAYIGRRVLAYAIDSDYVDLVERGFDLARRFNFADEPMREQMTRFLPQPIQLIETRMGHVMVQKKAPDFVSLRHLLDHVGAVLDPRHVAWIVSGLLNICCCLETLGIAHQAIDIDHCLVSPEGHAVQLAGGWWFAGVQGEPLSVLAERSARLAPPDVLHRRIYDSRLDQFLLRATALELLGSDPGRVPDPMHDFLLLPPAASAIADYEAWQRVLWDSFGERRFVSLAVTADDIYAVPSATTTH